MVVFRLRIDRSYGLSLEQVGAATKCLFLVNDNGAGGRILVLFHLWNVDLVEYDFRRYNNLVFLLLAFLPASKRFVVDLDIALRLLVIPLFHFSIITAV